MALVKIDEYQGSLIGETVVDALINSGIADILNKNGYIINVDGISEVKDDMIEDEPDNHNIRISKELALGYKKLCGFVEKNKVNKNNKLYIESLNELKSFDLELPKIFGVRIQETSEIELDKTGICVYKHEIKINKPKKDSEDLTEYAIRIFNSTADILLQSRLKGGI